MNTIYNYSDFNFSLVSKSFFQDIPFLDKKIVTIVAIAFACLALVFVALYWGCARDLNGFEKKEQERLVKEENEKIEKINSNSEQKEPPFNPQLLTDFLELAESRGAEITSFNFSHVTNEDFKKVIHLCPNLKFLKLGLNHKVNSKGLSELGLLTKLEVFDFNCLGHPINDVVMAQVGLLTQLKELRLHDSEIITNAGFAEIAKLTSLQKLVLGQGVGVNDEVEYFSGLTQLKVLYLHRCKLVSDEGLKIFSSSFRRTTHPKLQYFI